VCPRVSKRLDEYLISVHRVADAFKES
jgi:hypothetical protein